MKVEAIEKQLFNAQFPNVIETENAKGEIKTKILATIPNLRYLLRSYGVTVEYDEILKRQSVYFANSKTNHDLEDEAALMVIKSLCALNGLPLATADLLPALFVQNTVNPIVEWITSSAWDGEDRLFHLENSLNVGDLLSEHFRNSVLRLWMTQCVAAADNGVIGCGLNRHAVKKFELVLILQGEQGAKKTSWLNSLVPEAYRDYLKDGLHLDPTDRDSIKKCVSSWICELGEIDATFRRADIARLKAFLSNQTDEIRLPYNRTAANFKRRTSFCASVNGEQFLNDTSGSRRFITLPVIACNSNHNLNMQQVWSQIWHGYINGAIWWTDAALDGEIKRRNEKHNEISAIGEQVAISFNVNDTTMAGAEHLSPTAILIHCGIREPKRAQVKELTEFLQSKGFKYKQGAGGIRGFTIAKLFN